VNDSSNPLQSMLAVDREMRERCERLRRLARDLFAGAPGAVFGDRAAALRLEIESRMYAHHDDEETTVFPALLEAMAGSDPVCLRELTELLRVEHRALERSWEVVRRVLEQVEAGQPAQIDVESFRTFIDGYVAHIEREEQELFPMAERLLTDAEIASLRQKLLAGGPA
jgi:iron-sulfur cluster repair protein YtfE (RIC family)